MNRLLCLAVLLPWLSFCQTQPVPVKATIITGISSAASVIDNRSTAYRHNSMHTFCATGSGTWSATIQYADGSTGGPWNNFSDYGATISNTAPSCVGIGSSYHDFIRFSISGVATVTYKGTDGLYIPGFPPSTGGGGGGGTVTSVGLVAPPQFSISGSPVTSAGVLGFNWLNQPNNTVLAAGPGGTPVFRTLTASDIPQLGYESILTFNAPLSRTGNTVTIPQATASVNGFLASSDWTIFNGREQPLSFTAPLIRASNSISLPQSTTSQNGYLSAVDWNTFNGKAGTSSCGANLYATSSNPSGLNCAQVDYAQLSNPPVLRYQTVAVGGASQIQRARLNLIAGTNVTISPADNSGTNSTDITISSTGGTGGGYTTIQNQGTPVTARSVFNVSGNALTAADNSGQSRTDITLAQSPAASVSVVGTGRLLNTTAPISGGGDLTGDRTIACATCVTSASALTSGVITGAGGQAVSASGKALPAGAIVGDLDTQTLNNKTLTSPILTSPSATNLAVLQGANGNDAVYGKRITDTSPSGNLMHFQNAAGALDLWRIDIAGILQAGTVPVARVTGLAPSATIDTTNASNITSNTLADARLSSNVALRNTLNTFTGYNDLSTGRLRIPEATFASPPTAPVTGQVFLFSDDSSSHSCTGGGTSKTQCRYNGATYDPIGGGGGGSGITLQTNSSNNGSQSLLNLKNGSNVTLTDDGSGGVTINASGAAGTDIHARVGMSASITGGLPPSTWVQIPFNSETCTGCEDVGALHDNTVNNTRITVPSAQGGWYLSVCQVASESSWTSDFSVHVVVNGASLADDLHPTNGQPRSSSVSVQHMNPGDYMECWARNYSATVTADINGAATWGALTKINSGGTGGGTGGGGLSDPGAPGVMKRTTLNTTAIATCADVYKPGCSVADADLPSKVVRNDASTSYSDPGNQYFGKYDVVCDATSVSADNVLVKKSGAGCVVLSTSDTSITSGLVGLLDSGSTTVNGRVRFRGVGTCRAVGTINTGDWIKPSTTTAGYCEGSSTRPAAGTVIIGRANAPSGSTVPVDVFVDPNSASGGGGGTGDASTNTSTSVVNEVALFADTSGKLLQRATGTGLARLASGVQSASELSGDATTSGSNVVTVAKVNGVAITGTPTTGQVPTATSSTTATWQTPSGGGGGGTDIHARVGMTTTTVTGGLPASTWVQIHFDDESCSGCEDVGGVHDNTTNNTRLTVPTGQGGWYLGICNVASESTWSANFSVHVVINGTFTSGNDLRPTNGIPRGTSVSAMHLNAGDYMECWARNYDASFNADINGSATFGELTKLNSSGGSSIALKTNGTTNGSQSILNLKNGTNVTLSDDGVGGITINSSGGAGGTGGACTTVLAAGTNQISAALAAGATICITGNQSQNTSSIPVTQANVTLRCIPGVSIQQTTASTKLFDVTGDYFQMEGCTVKPPASGTAGNLLSFNSNHSKVWNVKIDNNGSTATNGAQGWYRLSGGTDHQILDSYCLASTDTCLAAFDSSAAIKGIMIRGVYMEVNGTSSYGFDTLITGGGISDLKFVNNTCWTKGGCTHIVTGLGDHQLIGNKGNLLSGGGSTTMFSNYAGVNAVHADNICNDQGVSYASAFVGCFYDHDSTGGVFHHNIAVMTGGHGVPFAFYDARGLDIDGNIAKGTVDPSTGSTASGTFAWDVTSPAIIILNQSTSADNSYNRIRGNTIYAPLSYTAAAIQVACTLTSGLTCNRTKVDDNIIVGTGTAGGTAIEVDQASSGVVAGVEINNNYIYNIQKGIVTTGTISDVQIGPQKWDTVTTKWTCGASAPCQINDPIAILFAAIPANISNGSRLFVSDANTACSAGSSTGNNCFRQNGAWTGLGGGSGGGDASTNTSTSVDSEVALFSGTGGKTLKRATGTGLARLSSGVQSAAELSGDVTTSGSNAATVVKVNGVSYGSAPSTNTVPVVSAANTASYTALPDCQDSAGNHLNFNATTHALSCGTSSSGGGGGAFSSITTGTNTTATMTVGSGATLTASGTGTVNATSLVGVAAVSVLDSSSVYCADAGSTDSYACNLSPALTAYVTGGRYRFKANTANTGAASINFNSLGAKTIKKAVGGVTTDLSDNDIRASQLVDVVYDGTNMQMQSTLGNAASGGGGYSTVASGGTNQTQQTTLNFNPPLQASNNAGASRTDVDFNPIKTGTGGYFIREEFVGSPASQSGARYAQAGTYATKDVNGTGSLTTITSTTAELGIWQMSSGATSGNDSYLTHVAEFVDNIGTFPIISSTSFTYETKFQLVTATNNYAAIGIKLYQNSAAAFSGGYESVYCDVTNTASAGNWACHTIATGTATNPTTTATAANTSWHILKIVATSSAVTFYIDGTQIAQSTTNIPVTYPTEPAWEIKTNTSGAAQLNVGSWRFVN